MKFSLDDNHKAELEKLALVSKEYSQFRNSFIPNNIVFQLLFLQFWLYVCFEILYKKFFLRSFHSCH